LAIAATAVVNNALFNVSSGTIVVGEWAMLAHNTSLLTGTHDMSKFGEERQLSIPESGRDIVVEEGAWLASNVTVLGPCRIGRHAVVAAGSVVRDDVEPFAVVAGVPAKRVGWVDRGDSALDIR
jgi:acetyltransferase-like isoleucine patch superfamily enzyme